MQWPRIPTIEQNIGLMAVVFCLLLGGTWGTVKLTIDYLLYQNATTAATEWARHLVGSVDDLEEIASGEQPSTASLAFFSATQESGGVFRYEIFDRNGYSQLVAEHGKVEPADISEHSDAAARAVATRQPVIDVQEGHGASVPLFYARAYVPVVAENRPIAVVAAYVDETATRNTFYKAILIAAISLCLLTGFSFTIPTVAWYRRTKEKQQADRRIRYLAQHDALTGLHNRATLIEALGKELAVLPIRGETLALHFIDIDRFKEVNDSVGHDGGDFLLKMAAERLRAVVRIGDIAARLGGDEFVVVQRGRIDKEDAQAFADRIAAALKEPTHFGEHELATTVSIGVALGPADGADAERLLKSADLALYQCKADGRNCVRFFRPEMDAALVARLALERTIRDAVQNQRFVLYFQPIFEVATQTLTGFEALIRLPVPDGTIIPPSVFIPVAEEIQLIDRISAWVLRDACQTAATWPEHLTVAVNLSPAQFRSGSVSELVAGVLAETGLAPRRLELEITETLLLANTEAILKQLQRLKQLGVSIVMDDFGTGYSSLSYLWRFPFDKIKIDGSFMQAFEATGHEAETVVKTIIALGRELHMRVTVEGVETAAQATFLDNADADLVQGFYFGRPMPPADIAANLLKGIHERMVKPQAPPSRGDEAERAKAAAKS